MYEELNEKGKVDAFDVASFVTLGDGDDCGEILDLISYGIGVTRNLRKPNSPLRLNYGSIDITVAKVLEKGKFGQITKVKSAEGAIYTFVNDNWVRENQ